MKVKSLRMPAILKDAERAMRSAVRKVLEEHRQKGLPIYVWQHDRIVRIPAHRINHSR